MSDESKQKSCSVSLSLATARPELLCREQQCIEMVCRDAVAKGRSLPELIVSPRPWWRPWASRPIRPYPVPQTKTVGDLASMYGQIYQAEMVAQWIAVLYGGEAGVHYSDILMSMQQQNGAAVRRWIESNPDGPLPSRRPVATDWLSRVESELPKYDSGLIGAD